MTAHLCIIWRQPTARTIHASRNNLCCSLRGWLGISFASGVGCSRQEITIAADCTPPPPPPPNTHALPLQKHDAVTSCGTTDSKAGCVVMPLHRSACDAFRA